MVGETCVVDDVSIWHLFSRWRRFLHRGMASLISVYWCGFTNWSWETQGSSFRVRNLLSVLRACLHHPLSYDETDDESDTVWESFSSILCDDDWGICLRNQRMFGLFFSCAHVVCREFTISCFFLRYESVFFLSGPVQHHFCVRHYGVRLYGAFLMFFHWRWYGTLHVSWNSKPRLFLRTHIGAQHVLSLPRLHIQFSSIFAVVACFFFDCVEPTSTASEHAITTARYMTSIFSVSHPSSCRVGKCQSRGVLVESSRFSFIGKVFRAAFSWFTECEFRSGQDVVSWTIARRVFFRRVVFQTFRQSFISTVVGWSENLGVGSRFVRRNGLRSFVVSCLHVCLAAFECCGVCCCGRL